MGNKDSEILTGDSRGLQGPSLLSSLGSELCLDSNHCLEEAFREVFTHVVSITQDRCMWAACPQALPAASGLGLSVA